MSHPKDLGPVSFSQRASRRLQRDFQKLRKAVRRAATRLFYSLPHAAKRDPRRNRISFKGHCTVVDGFSPTLLTTDQDWYLAIRPQEKISRRPPISLDRLDEEKFNAGIGPYQGGHNFVVPEVFLACIHQAKLYSRDCVVLSRDERVLVESALSRDDVLEGSGLFDTITRRITRHVSGSYGLLTSPWSHSFYYHWVMEALPRLSLLESIPELRGLPLVVPKTLANFQRDTLRLAGVEDSRLFHFDGTCWEFEQLYYPEVLSTSSNPSPQTVAWLRQRFLKPKEPPPKSTRLLYVTRRDATKRKVLNEDEVIACLQQRGFEVICPGDFSFAEQVELFSSAKVVIGPHGAAFTNMVFAPRGTLLIEFFGDNYINGCFWALTNLCDQRHAFLTFSTETLDYVVSLERLKALLSKAAGL